MDEKRDVRIFIDVYQPQDEDTSSELLCKLVLRDSDKRIGRFYPIDDLDRETNDFKDLMDEAANEYPGFMLGLPWDWANSILILTKRLFKPAMWGFWLALLALAWNGYNEWVR